MYRWRLGGTVLSLALAATAFAAVSQSCPAGWTAAVRGRGVLLCQNGQSHVLWVDLSSGARIRNAYQFAGTAGSSTNVGTCSALGPFTSVAGLHPGSDDGIRTS